MKTDRMCSVLRPTASAWRPSARAAWVARGLVAAGLSLGLLCGSPAQAQAQTPPTDKTAPERLPSNESLLLISEQTADKPNQRLERTHLEDDGSSIDEVRYGGETRSVTVQPKARVPAYEMRPTHGARQAYTVDVTATPRVWNLLNF